MRTSWISGLTAGLLVALWAATASACPTCKDSLLQNDPAAAGLVQGYFWSILFMMSMPFLILGGLGSYFYFEIRKAQRASQERATLTPAPDPRAYPADPQWKPAS